ncbi:hypothetical protein [Pyruvatibacter mobilis]|uniref:hypothetical protein n=1 Tax=Pyruvatibacter mobilis TaxID=1712261 RepID=UPI003BADB77F
MYYEMNGKEKALPNITVDRPSPEVASFEQANIMTEGGAQLHVQVVGGFEAVVALEEDGLNDPDRYWWVFPEDLRQMSSFLADVADAIENGVAG